MSKSYRGKNLKIDLQDEEFVKTIDKRVDTVCGQAAEMAFRIADSLVPVDTGTLRKSIELSKSKFENGGYIVMAHKPDKHSAIKFNAIEFGHITTTGKYIPPQSFMRPAIKKVKKVFKKMMQEELGK